MSRTLIVSGVVAMAAVALSMSQPAQAQTTLTVSHWYPPTHGITTDVVVPWAQQVEKVTEGRVKAQLAPKVIGSLPAQFDVVRDGLADVVMIVNGYTPGRFPISEIGELPFLSDRAVVGSAAYYRLHQKHLAKYNEYKGTHVLSTFSGGSGHFYNNKRPLRAMDDFRGLKLRSPIPVTNSIATAVGAVPVQKPINELYELVSTGVLDGAMVTRESAKGFKLLEVLPHLTIVPGGVYNSILTFLANETKWASIQKKDQEAIMKISGEAFAARIGAVYDKADTDGVEAMRAAGKNVETASGAFLENMKKALAPVETEWVEKAKKAGVADPAAILVDFRADIARATAATN